MNRSNGLQRQYQRETIDVKDSWRLLVKPIAIGQFIIPEPPCDIGVSPSSRSSGIGRSGSRIAVTIRTRLAASRMLWVPRRICQR